MNDTPNPDIETLSKARLAEITAEDSATLLQFAECRLLELGVPSSFGEDVTQRAFEAVMVGLNSIDGGRKPRRVDVINKAAFLNYMRGVISSLLYALTRKKGFPESRQDLFYKLPEAVCKADSPAKEAEFADLRNELFSRMRARAPSRLLRTIDAWESVFLHSDRVPAPGHRKYVKEVKTLAQEVIGELGSLRQR